eukprot:169368-Pyramimonas_sp.AAC.1
MLSAIGGKVDCTRALLSKGANTRAVDKEGYTALHFAVGCESQVFECIKLLVSSHASFEAVTKYGESPLDTAAKACNFRAHGWLRAQGAQTGAELGFPP